MTVKCPLDCGKLSATPSTSINKLTGKKILNNTRDWIDFIIFYIFCE